MCQHGTIRQRLRLVGIHAQDNRKLRFRVVILLGVNQMVREQQQGRHMAANSPSTRRRYAAHFPVPLLDSKALASPDSISGIIGEFF